MNSTAGTSPLAWILGTLALTGALGLGAYTLLSAPGNSAQDDHGEAHEHRDHGREQHGDDEDD